MPTALEWARVLEAKIDEQLAYATPFEKRYCNEHILPFIAGEYREVYGGGAVDGFLASTLEAPRAGIGATVIDALVERLTVTGWTSPDKDVNTALAAAWTDSDLDVMHREASREALVKRSALGVASMATNSDRAVATIESSEQAAVHRMQGPPYDVDAYLKVWVDEWTGTRNGLLRIEGRDVDLVESPSAEVDPEWWSTNLSARELPIHSRWRIAGAPRRRTTPVPVVEFAHRPRLLKPPSSELERMVTEIDIYDLIEGLMVFAGHFGAVPIRFAEGMEMPRDPKDPTKPLLGPDGKPALGFKPRADHFWFGAPPRDKDGKPVGQVRFGQLTPAGLESFVTWAEHALAGIRRQSSVASTYFSLDIKSHMSAELLKTDEAPMVRRILGMGRDGNFGQAWRRLGQHMMTLEGRRETGIRSQWADPQTRMEAQAVDSFQKAVASGIGVKTAAEEFLGWSPELAEKAVNEAQAAREAADPFELLDPTTRAAIKASQVRSGDPEPAGT